MKNPLIDLTGKKFGKITVIEQVKKPDNIKYTRATYWLCKCECGNEKIINGYKLRRGFIETCGCGKKGSGTKKGEKISSVMKKKSKPEYKGQTYGVALLYRSYKSGAKTRKIEFDLSIDKFFSLVTSKCYYCGIGIFDNREVKLNGIDRIDNSKGYIKSNVVSCCDHCNKAKHAYSKDEFLKWAERLYSYSVLPKKSTS